MTERLGPHIRRELSAATLKHAEPATLAAEIAMTVSGRAHFDGMVERVADAIERCA